MDHMISPDLSNMMPWISSSLISGGGGPTALLEIGHMAHAFNIPMPLTAAQLI